MMEAKKRQHYVDRALLKKFLAKDQQKLWVYDRKARDFREQYPSDIAVEGHLYSLDTPELQDQRYIIEETLQKLQDKALPAFEKLRKGETIDQKERNYVCEYVGLQTVRTPENLEITQEYSQRMGQFFYEEMVSQMIEMPKDEYEKMMAKYQAKEGIDANIPQFELKTVLDEKRLKAKAPIDYHKGIMLDAGLKIASGFSKRHWIILHTKPGKSFVISDVPVMQMPIPTSTPPEGRGPLAAGVANYFPFARDAALLILPDNNRIIEHGAINDKGLHKFNQNLALDSKRIVISGSKRLLESIVSKSGISHIETRILFDDELIRQQVKRILGNRKLT